MVGMGLAPRWGVLSATVLIVAACHPVEHRGHVHFIGPKTGFMQVNATLNCPDRSGDLRRSGVAADGMSCTYGGPNDETVSLQLTPLVGGDAQTVLARLETQLKGDAGPTGVASPVPPAPPAPPAPPGAGSKDWDAGTSADDDDDKDDDKSPPARRADAGRRDHTKIDLPGLHIATNGDKADVSLPGLSIHANGDTAEVHAGWWGRSATIEGHDGGAVIRVGRADTSGVDSMLIMTSDRPGPTGYRAVGYVAKGPPSGPLVIAVFKAKRDAHSEHDPAGDGLKKLVQLNVHQGLGWFADADKEAQP